MSHSSMMDIEDIGQSQPLSLTTPGSSPKKSTPQSQSEDFIEKMSNVVTPPRVSLSSTTFFSWLKQRKHVWRNLRTAPLKTKSGRTSSLVSYGLETTGEKRRKLANVQSYLQHQLDTVHNSELHILERKSIFKLNDIQIF